MRLFLSRHDLHFKLDFTGVPLLQRQNDAYIMDFILASNHYTPAEIRKMNYCRLFLDVVTISDITNASSTQIDPTSMHGHPSPTSRRNTYLSIHQDRPSQKEWVLWRRANLLWSDINGRLRTPLGQWLYPFHDHCLHQQFAYQHRRRLWIYQAATKQYREHRASTSTMIHKATARSRIFSSIPIQAIPVDATQLDSETWSIATPGHSSILQPMTQDPSTLTFLEFVQTLDEWESELLQHVHIEEDPFEFCVALQTHQRVVTDGSVRKGNHGAYG